MPSQGSTKARGYGWAHEKLRAEYQRRMDRGEQFDCPKCHRPVPPTRWDLGHVPGDKSRYLGPQHVRCNRDTTAERRANSARRRWKL